MLPFFSSLRDFHVQSAAIRMLLAVVCGGLIGLERTYHRRPAGLRTHMLICLGASMTTMISQYLLLNMHFYTDMARIGAQVVAGIGFIGAGTIVVSRNKKVSGLTTAAGLWTCAIVGLTLGAGFYEGGLFVAGSVLLAEVIFSQLERLILRSSPEVKLQIHYVGKRAMDRMLQYFRENHIKIVSMQVLRPQETGARFPSTVLLLRLNKKIRRTEFLKNIRYLEGIISVEELPN